MSLMANDESDRATMVGPDGDKVGTKVGEEIVDQAKGCFGNERTESVLGCSRTLLIRTLHGFYQPSERIRVQISISQTARRVSASKKSDRWGDLESKSGGVGPRDEGLREDGASS